MVAYHSMTCKCVLFTFWSKDFSAGGRYRKRWAVFVALGFLCLPFLLESISNTFGFLLHDLFLNLVFETMKASCRLWAFLRLSFYPTYDMLQQCRGQRGWTATIKGIISSLLRSVLVPCIYIVLDKSYFQQKYVRSIRTFALSHFAHTMSIWWLRTFWNDCCTMIRIDSLCAVFRSSVPIEIPRVISLGVATL